jgi:minor extracellular protease Epr
VEQHKQRFVILPADNVFNAPMTTRSAKFLRAFGGARNTSIAAAAKADPDGPPADLPDDADSMTLIDSVDLNEGALVEMTQAQSLQLKRHYPGLRIEREVILYPMKLSPARLDMHAARLPKAAAATKRLVVLCVDSVTQKPVTGADVVVILNRKRASGIMGVQTDANGTFETVLPAQQALIDAVICAPLAKYWPAGLTAITLPSDGQLRVTVKVAPIKDGFKDAIGLSIQPSTAKDGKGVKIAVIDAGTAAAPGLNIVSGLNTTETEAETLYGDNGSGHGTHVAGIISRLAPSAELHIYRVFAAGEEGASEIAIAKAVRHATDAGCDLINMSLGQDTEAFTITRATRRARSMGVVCIAAAGNDAGPVSYPARSIHMLAVSAYGILNAWPKESLTGRSVATKPPAVDPYFFANFSNADDEVDFIGPGVGIISWVSEASQGVMDGTSMASPAVCGLVARLLSQRLDILQMEKNQQRSDDIVRMAFEAAREIGFGNAFEGSGRIDTEGGVS